MTEIAIVGEAWGEAEARERTPFIGPAGYLLSQMLEAAEISRADCFVTNVFNLHPPRNDLETLCGPKAGRLPGYPALIKGKYIDARLEPEVTRLAQELYECRPNLVICLGNTALWAFRGITAISKYRGTTEISTHTISGLKTLATYHPAGILRQYELRPIAIADLRKAKRESAYPDIRRPERTIFVPETIEDLISLLPLLDTNRLAVDIETAGNQITCIGFAPNPGTAIVVPIVDYRRKDRSYWKHAGDESRMWRIIQEILENRHIGKTFQNGLYDIAFLWRSLGIAVLGAEHDTMLLHHALQPESLKGLGFLGSIYCDEGAWKNERHVATIKADE